MVVLLAKIGSFFIGLAILLLVLKILTLPLRIVIRFIINSIVGAICLFICAFFGLIIHVELWMIILVGLLGFPGFLIALVILFLL